MGRPKSTNPRNLTATVRLTAPESSMLTERYGTPGKGLRALLNAEKKRVADVASAPAAREGMDRQEPVEGSVKTPAKVVEVPADLLERKVVISPRQSGKTKKAQEAVEAVKAEGLNVTVAGPIPESGLRGLPDTPTPNPPAKKPASSSDAQKRHLHKPEGDPVRTFAEKGVQWKVYLCECGEELKR